MIRIGCLAQSVCEVSDVRPDPSGLASFGEGTVKGREDVTRFLREDPARLCLGHHATRTPEEGDTEFAFQLPDRLGEGRLRDVEPFSGPSEVQLLADCEEVAQMPKLDRGLRQRSLALPKT